MKYISWLTLKKDSYLSLYYHSWEFADIGEFDIPYYLKKQNGLEMVRQMESYLIYLKKSGIFTTHYKYLKNSKLLFE